MSDSIEIFQIWVSALAQRRGVHTFYQAVPIRLQEFKYTDLPGYHRLLPVRINTSTNLLLSSGPGRRLPVWHQSDEYRNIDDSKATSHYLHIRFTRWNGDEQHLGS